MALLNFHARISSSGTILLDQTLDQMRYQWFWQRHEQPGLSTTLAEEATSCSAADAALQFLMPTRLGLMLPLFKIVQDAALMARELPSD